MKNYLTILVLFFALYSSAQTVSTFFNATTENVTDAVVLDNQGNIYGSDYNGTNVYKITASGIVTVFATGFNTPNGLAFNSQGHLYVCDQAGNNVYVLSSSGIFLDTIPMSSPSGIIKSLDSDTMIIARYLSNIITKLAPDGSFSNVVSGAPLNGPVGLAYDSTGTLYIGNFTDRVILKLDVDAAHTFALVVFFCDGYFDLAA